MTEDGDKSVYTEESDESLTVTDTDENEVSDEQEPAEKSESAEKDDKADEKDETTAQEDAATIEGAEVLSDGEDGTTGKVLLADERAVGELDGRDYVGQTVKNINGTDYILIGNVQQLQAIGTGKRVVDKVWYRATTFNDWEVLYKGDADLSQGEALIDQYYAEEDMGGVGYGHHGADESGDPNPDRSPNSGLTYDIDANYIIFRDIDLSGIDWEPLMFSGTMIGAKASVGSKIWDTNATKIVATDKPIISNVTVRQDSPINIEEHYGIGFFGTISNKVDASYDLGVLGVGASYDITVKPARVENIKLSNVDVSTLTSEHVESTSLIEGLLGLVSAVLGAVLDVLDVLLGWVFDLLNIPSLTDLLKTLITSLVTNAAADPSYFATGSFAGRVVGDVTIIGCEVENASVDNQNDISGGFVGYSAGDTEYEGLSDLLGAIVAVLSGLLNVIPGLGLGDLIDILLGQEGLLPVGSLIPAKYSNPTFENNVVYLADGETIGRSNTAQNGGFFGAQIGTVAKNNVVAIYQPEGSSAGSGSYTVLASRYAGGFSGLSRNDVLKGTLSADTLGIELIRVSHPQSLTEGCKVDANVTVTAGDYSGGFSGALSNSFSVNDEITGAATVTAEAYTYTDPHDSGKSLTTTGTYAGGYTGIATLGWKSNLGASDASDDNVTLLSLLKETLVGLLTAGDVKSGDLLSLVGIDESGILGLELRGTTSVGADGGYAGGIVGSGDGLMIAASDTEHLNKIGFYKSKTAVDFGQAGAGFAHPAARSVSIEALSSVTAGTEDTEADYAGGIAGKLGTASVGGVLNSTVGIGGYLPFEVSKVTVTGVPEGYRVSATGDAAGGGIGEATGGTVGGDSRSDGSESVSLKNVALVSANSRAGGLAGVAGPGDLVGTGGLNLLGLVKIDGLLSVAEGVEVEARNVCVSGVEAGMRVEATGAPANEGDRSVQYIAGGFIGKASSVRVIDSYVENLLSVKASDESGYAGGFVGTSVTGGLADVSDKTALEGLASIGSILNLVGYLIPEYSNIYVSYTDDGGVEADVAGGFAGDFQSGFLNTVQEKDNGQIEYAGQKPSSGEFVVYNIDHVTGNRFAGGFGGRVTSGGLASSGGQGGLSILGGLNLSINASDLLSLVDAYVPMLNYAGVSSEPKDGGTDDGFVVQAKTADEGDSVTGAAGGYIGYASGVQVGYSDVTSLRHTTVVAPDDLESKEAQSYFTDESSYAVTAPRYAGGFFGLMDIGDAASVGSGLKLLGQTLSLNHLLSALSVVVSTAEHSDVNGQPGGYSVLASGTENGDAIGHAGGFAGMVLGGHIQDANAHNFEYVVGQESAGGYAGTVAPGNLADVLGSSDVLGGLVSTDATLAQVAGDFVPSIRNSETTCVPCGGAVRAQALSDAGHLRGMAGGYVGHNQGGQISGNNTDRWKYEAAYSGPTREAAAVRIRSVYGAEFAGGFTGLMHPGDTASTGNLSLLWGLVEVNNLLSALSIAYPTEENTAAYGPLDNLDYETWNSWVDFVGKYGGYGADLAETGKVENQDELDAKLDSYVYGFHAVAGRDELASAGEDASIKGGSAGGYVGTMIAGTVTNGQAHDAKLVRGMRAAGGFAGVAEAGGAAELGSVSILGDLLTVDAGQLLNVAQVFVPVIKSSSVEGYRGGLTVESAGTSSREKDIQNSTGNAGGYIGYGAGAQVWGDEAAEGAEATGCDVSGLRRVSGALYAGGFAGKLTSGSVANANTDASDGFLQAVLDTLLDGTGIGNLADVLQATMSTVRGASANAVATEQDSEGNVVTTAGDGQWGFTVDAIVDDGGDARYPEAAGGFAGMIEATVLGELSLQSDGSTQPNADAANSVNGLRGVDGGSYAGGFVGLADVGGVAQVAGGDDESANVSILKLIGLGDIAALQVFQPCIYSAKVTGVADGMTIRAHDASVGGHNSAARYSGNAGGFAGSIMSGTIQQGEVEGLSSVSGPSYTGGFVGYTGKSGVLDVEDVDAIGSLLGANASVINTFSTLLSDSHVAGIEAGYTVASSGTGVADGEDAQQIAGGFAGYADLANIEGCSSDGLKRVSSGEIAGGFAGKGTYDYLVSVGADSPLVQALLAIVSTVVSALWLDKGLDGGVIDINLTNWILHLEILGTGEDGGSRFVQLHLLGIPVSISLNADEGDSTGVAVVKIGDSEISLNVSRDESGNVVIDENGIDNVALNLIKGNSTKLEGCKVTGIADGYDVFAGGSSQTSGAMDTAGSDTKSAYAGGFMGFSNEAQLYDNEMLYADVIKGAAGLTGPFTGVSNYTSEWWFNDIDKIERGNGYHVYRDPSLVGSVVTTPSAPTNELIVEAGTSDNGVPGGSGEQPVWARFDVTTHEPNANTTNHGDWKDATAGQTPIDVWKDNGATAVLMANAAVSDNTGSLTPEPEEGQDPCAATADLTITKVWNDHGDVLNRPDSITVELWQSYTDASGRTVSKEYDGKLPDGTDDGSGVTSPITLSSAEASPWTNTWQHVIKMLPVAWDDEGTIRYFTYSVKEVTVEGGDRELSEYTTIVNPAEDGTFHIVLTNFLGLPDAGGPGTAGIIMAGLATIVLGGVWLERQRRRRGPSRSYAGAHFANDVSRKRRASNR